MRDPKRLYEVYNELCKIHMEHCPDWRVGQFIENVFGHLDPFYWEEDRLLAHVKTFFNIKE